jgi:N-acetyl-gamma-glutamyl-phosphate reductase
MIKAAIVGIGGYTGEELLKILSKHPRVKIAALCARSESETRELKDVYPQFAHLGLKVEPFDAKKTASLCDVVFLALPHAAAFEAAAPLLEAGVKVIDLSADFRIKNLQTYEKWYKVKHTAEKYIKEAVYGLSELYAGDIKNARLIANPGCYPTSVLLAAAPAVKSGIIDLPSMVIDSKSAISGAGRKSAKEYFEKEHPNFRAYKPGGAHRHIPEIEQELSLLYGKDVTVSFTPHIIPVERGMFSTVYAGLKKKVSETEILNEYARFYEGKIFVKILSGDAVPSIAGVVNTNYCEIGIKIDERANRLIILSAIDNLVKGASGQAVQNMNIMFGLPETEGLL